MSTILRRPAFPRLGRFPRALSVAGLVVGVFLSALAPAATLSLDGEWRFELGAATDAPSRDLAGRIHLPGTIDDAGLGPVNQKPPTLEGPYRKSDYAGPAWYQRDVDIPAAWAGST